MALVALLTSVDHLSRRKAAELVGVRISVGVLSTVAARVSAAVQPAFTGVPVADSFPSWAQQDASRMAPL